jgi:hypothetical protein
VLGAATIHDGGGEVRIYRELELIRQHGVSEQEAWVERNHFVFRDHGVMERVMGILEQNPILERYSLKDQKTGRLILINTVAKCVKARSAMVATGHDPAKLTIHRFDPRG